MDGTINEELNSFFESLGEGKLSNEVELPFLSAKIKEICSSDRQEDQIRTLYSDIRKVVTQSIRENNEIYFSHAGDIKTSIACSKHNLNCLMYLEEVGDRIQREIPSEYCKEIYKDIYEMSRLLQKIAPNNDFFSHIQKRVLAKGKIEVKKEENSTEEMLFYSSEKIFWKDYYYISQSRDYEIYNKTRYWGWSGFIFLVISEVTSLYFSAIIGLSILTFAGEKNVIWAGVAFSIVFLFSFGFYWWAFLYFYVFNANKVANTGRKFKGYLKQYKENNIVLKKEADEIKQMLQKAFS